MFAMLTPSLALHARNFVVGQAWALPVSTLRGA